VIGCVDLANRDAVDAIATPLKSPINWAFVGRLDKTSSLPAAELVERIAAAANRGLIAVVTDRADEELWQQLDRIGLPLVQLSKIIDTSPNVSYRALSEQTAKLYSLLNLPGKRGTVGRSVCADLAIFKVGNKVDEKQAADWKQLKRVIVAGETVWEDNQPSNSTPGTFLRRS
jgi:hypothetical protein